MVWSVDRPGSRLCIELIVDYAVDEKDTDREIG